MSRDARVEVRFEGRVQGVGFRYATVRIASRFSVRGFIRNLPGGAVELVAEGEAGEVENFLGEVEKAMCESIDRTDVQRTAARGEFSRFEIRY